MSKQKQSGVLFVNATITLGDFTCQQMRILGDLATAFADGTIRITAEQNLVFRWVPADAVPELYRQLAAAGMGLADAGTIADVTSCPGAESCKLAVRSRAGSASSSAITCASIRSSWPRRPICKSRSAAARTAADAITSRASGSRAACEKSAARRFRSTS